MNVEWRPVLIGFVLSFATGIVLAMLWGFFGVAFFLAAEQSATSFVESPVAVLGGLFVGFVPVVLGAVYVTYSVSQNPFANSGIYGGLNVVFALISIPLFPDESTTIWDVLYLVAAIPLSLATTWCIQSLPGKT